MGRRGHTQGRREPPMINLIVIIIVTGTSVTLSGEKAICKIVRLLHSTR